MQQFPVDGRDFRKNFPKWVLTNVKVNAVAWMVGAAALILFACSSLRHALFQSGAFDLGIFDQGVYLISQGKQPVCSIVGFHILGDHAAWVLYPLALLYRIYPDVHWLFAVQAGALAVAAVPVWGIARHAGLSEREGVAVAAVYLLHPLVFNANLFDFHPEVMAVPALLGAILAARLGRAGLFAAAIAFVLGCKAVLALTVAATGVWLLFFERRRLCGGMAIAAGVAWFLIASRVIIPYFSGGEPAAVGRYAYLGSSVLEIAGNLLLKPGLVLGKVFSAGSLEYVGLLALPVIWGLSPRYFAPLIGAIPALALNVLSESGLQRNLVQHYSLPVLPFLFLAAIAKLSTGETPVPTSECRTGVSPVPKIFHNRDRLLFLWAMLAFLALAKYGYFGSIYLDELDTWQATRSAISEIKTGGSVLTAHEIAPHLTHRQVVSFTNVSSPPRIHEFDYILLNVRHPGWRSTEEFAAGLVGEAKNSRQFQLVYQRDQVYLFVSSRVRSG
ncbi:MAG: DUF2079 domain-containing protein [Oscillatoria princeps RMCB-10]|jgi:uncharacterized membrane protein|nr:DUF2079 domain-containing protein [Oscillatoria princeps RMCB-10]